MVGSALGFTGLRSELERREERRPGDPVATRIRADEVHRAPRPSGGGGTQVLPLHEADAHRVHEGVVRVAGSERDMPADVGDANAVAVERDSADDAAD